MINLVLSPSSLLGLGQGGAGAADDGPGGAGFPHDDVEGGQDSPGAGSVNVVSVSSAVGNGGQTQWIERGGSDCLESLDKKEIS